LSGDGGSIRGQRGERGEVVAAPPGGEFTFLEEAVVEGDTWATFVAFSKSWEEANYRTTRIESIFLEFGKRVRKIISH